MMTPYSMAFPDSYTNSAFDFDISMNVLFSIDIFVNFFTAYYDDDF